MAKKTCKGFASHDVVHHEQCAYYILTVLNRLNVYSVSTKHTSNTAFVKSEFML